MCFEEHPELKGKITDTSNLSLTVKNIKQPMEKQKVPSFIDNAIMQRTFQNYSQNNLFLYLSTHFGEQSAMRLMKTYNVGSARKWGNSTVFWQVDISGRVHTGKIMQYDAETGKRIKEPYARVSWVHTELNLPDFTLDQCFLWRTPVIRPKKAGCHCREREDRTYHFLLYTRIHLASYRW